VVASPKRRKGTTLRIVATLIALALLVGLVLVVAPRSKTAPEPTRLVDNAPEQPGPSPTLPPRTTPTERPRVRLPDGGYAEPVDPHDTPAVPPPRPAGRFPYPPGSQPLTEGTNPATQPPEDDVIDPEQGDRVVFGPRVAVVHPEDPLVIDLQVLNRLGAAMPIGDGVARFRPDGSDIEKGPWFSVPLVDDGSGRDLAASDQHYTATFQPSSDQKAALLSAGTHVFVDVGFTPPGGKVLRRFSTVMQYSREPDATLSGKYTDALDQGSLVINAGVTVTVAGQYRIIGSLYGGGQAIAFAQKATTLAVGDGTIPLLFFGKILHDKGIDGPYELRFVMLFEHEPTGDVPGDTVDPAYTTQAYSAKSFSDAPYVAPAPSFEVVDMNSPSQQGKPPALISASDNQNLLNTTPTIKADPTNSPPRVAPTGTK
jgi:hypothetical protein